MKKERLFAQSKHNRLLLFFLFVFVAPAKRCDLENHGSHLPCNRSGRPNFSKKGKEAQIFANVKWMLTYSR
jgi:hypothetical protein